MEKEAQRVWEVPESLYEVTRGPFLMEKKAPDGPSGKLDFPTRCHVCCPVCVWGGGGGEGREGGIFLVHILPFIKVTRSFRWLVGLGVSLRLHFGGRVITTDRGINFKMACSHNFPAVLRVGSSCRKHSLGTQRDPSAVCVCLVGSGGWSSHFACLFVTWAYLGEFSQALGISEETGLDKSCNKCPSVYVCHVFILVSTCLAIFLAEQIPTCFPQ